MFDDFGGEILGDSAASNSDVSPQLQEQISNYKTIWVQKDAQRAKNWRQGNWKVRGFSLDQYSSSSSSIEVDTDAAGRFADIHVSKVIMGMDEQSIVVGRTDGSVVLVTLGTEYWTRFRAAASMNDVDDQAGPDDDNASLPQFVPDDNDSSSLLMVPFEVTHHFMAGNSISAMMVADSEQQDRDDTLIITAGADGVIHVWTYPDTIHDKVLPLRRMEAHKGPVVALKKVSMRTSNKELMFSASADGIVALWDLWTGDLVVKCQLVDDQEPAVITCADVEGLFIYVGLASGYVMGYSVDEMVQEASEGRTCATPSGRFKAHDGRVTAMACAGEGSLGLSRPGTKSSMLLTGGSDGLVKQWEMISDESCATTKLQHWPRLSSQRMKRRAHLFEGHAPGEITSLACVDPSKILSAGADGTVRAWSPSKGTELFRMDGFTESLSSLCLVEDLLITDGMEKFVCVHDFDVDNSDFNDSYELDL